VLREVLHNWDDEHARHVLQNCHRAARSGSKLLVGEVVLPREPDASMALAFQLDLIALVAFSGIERTCDEWTRLLASAGYWLEDVRPGAIPVSAMESARRGPTERSTRVPGTIRFGTFDWLNGDSGGITCVTAMRPLPLYPAARTSNLARVANGMAAGLNLSFEWIHCQCHALGTMWRYCAPLRELELRPEQASCSRGTDAKRASLSAICTLSTRSPISPSPRCALSRLRKPDSPGRAQIR
jgi:hypothetical protein